MKKSKVILTIISLVLVVAMSVAGTLAFLKVKTTDVKNTFSPSNIGLTLDETTTDADYKMIPGVKMSKNPLVTVTSDIDAYVFVKVVKSANFDTYFEYQIAAGWTELTAGSGIYWREVAKNAADKDFEVLANNEITTRTTVEKDVMDSLKDNKPTMTFTAYAVQKDGFATPELAWAEASK